MAAKRKQETRVEEHVDNVICMQCRSTVDAFFSECPLCFGWKLPDDGEVCDDAGDDDDDDDDAAFDAELQKLAWGPGFAVDD